MTGYKKYYPCVSRQTDKGGGLQIQIKCKQRCKNNRVTNKQLLTETTEYKRESKAKEISFRI